LAALLEQRLLQPFHQDGPSQDEAARTMNDKQFHAAPGGVGLERRGAQAITPRQARTLRPVGGSSDAPLQTALTATDDTGGRLRRSAVGKDFYSVRGL
jgi:hypothetical protein